MEQRIVQARESDRQESNWSSYLAANQTNQMHNEALLNIAEQPQVETGRRLPNVIVSWYR